jgi:hypothetical protein
MIIATTYEQYKNLPKNKGKDSKAVYKEWLFEESKMLMMVDGWVMSFNMQSNPFSLGVVGPGQSTAGGSGEGSNQSVIPPPPTVKVTYYFPDGNSTPNGGYYEPDSELLLDSYYVYA